MWLRQFAKPVRRLEWAATRPSVRGARLSAMVARQQFEELDIPQVAELLLVETGALGAPMLPGTCLTHDGATVEVVDGPHPLPSDRSWEYYAINTRRAA